RLVCVEPDDARAEDAAGDHNAADQERDPQRGCQLHADAVSRTVSHFSSGRNTPGCELVVLPRTDPPSSGSCTDTAIAPFSSTTPLGGVVTPQIATSTLKVPSARKLPGIQQVATCVPTGRGTSCHSGVSWLRNNTTPSSLTMSKQGVKWRPGSSTR